MVPKKGSCWTGNSWFILTKVECMDVKKPRFAEAFLMGVGPAGIEPATN